MSKIYLTMILPKGCNLDCSYCYLRWRGEVAQQTLQLSQYQKFLWWLILMRQLSAFSIHGDEPLLDKVWPTTLRLCNLATRFGIPTGVVTNGTLLDEKRAKMLQAVCSEITVSIDAAGLLHDKLRGKRGAFVQTMVGLANAVRYFPPGNVTVNSVLMPGKAAYLSEVPALIRSVSDWYQKPIRWLIQPLIDPRKAGGEKVVGLASLAEDMEILEEYAADHGIVVFLEDGLGNIRKAKEVCLDQATRLSESIGPDLALRLSPDASLSIREQVLETNNPAKVARWDGKTNPAIFVDQACDQAGLPRPERRWYTKIFA